MAARDDSVFVVIGSERELTQKGLVRREGGTLLMFGRGKTMVPGRTLDPSQFTVLSKVRDRQIMLPRADKEYRIVSRQALEFTDLAQASRCGGQRNADHHGWRAVLGAVQVPDSGGEVARRSWEGRIGTGPGSHWGTR